MPSPPPVDLARIGALAQFEELARERLDPQAVDYVAGGGWDEVTLTDNVAAFRRRRFRPRVLVDTSAVDPSTELLGRPVAMPVGIAPMALHGLCHRDGELASARAGAAAGIPFCLSTVSSRSIEEVAAASAPVGLGPRWFQLYVHRDRGFSRSLVERAAAAGYQALVLTVDLPILGYRDRDRQWPTPLNAELGNFPGGDGPTVGGSGLDDLIDARHAPLTWADLDEIRGWSGLPLVVKGILTGDDARLAVEAGAAALVVSNHGGRQLDRVPGAIDALPEVVAAVGGDVEVYLDGGVRRGLDILTALALGARAVFVGRPILWSLAVGGEAGVARALAILREELERGMALLGTPRVADIGPEHLAPGSRS